MFAILLMASALQEAGRDWVICVAAAAERYAGSTDEPAATIADAALAECRTHLRKQREAWIEEYGRSNPQGAGKFWDNRVADMVADRRADAISIVLDVRSVAGEKKDGAAQRP